MAHKTGKEETEFKVVPETLSLCVRCSVAGNSATNNLCQKCFNTTKTASSSSAAASSVIATSGGGAQQKTFLFGEKSCRSSSDFRLSLSRDVESRLSSEDPKKSDLTDGVVVKRQVNRCSDCRRKVGLTVFRCRCGELLCAEHRYPDRHDCSYDYKAVGREVIAKENPLNVIYLEEEEDISGSPFSHKIASGSLGLLLLLRKSCLGKLNLWRFDTTSGPGCDNVKDLVNATSKDSIRKILIFAISFLLCSHFF